MRSKTLGGKTMFCFKCGQQIPDDAQFCSKCGTAQKSTVTQEIAKNNTSSSDFDREAIKIHLSDILALECMKIKLNTDYEESNDKLTYEQNNNYVERFSIPNGYVWLAYHDGKYHIGAFRGYGEGAYTGEYLNREGMLNGEAFLKYAFGLKSFMGENMGVVQHNGEFYWGVIDQNSLPIITKPNFWWDVGGSNILQQKMRQASARDGFLQVFENFKKNAPNVYQTNLTNTVQPLQRRVDGISKEYQKVDELLQKAYDINIIPKQFRNIHAIWFIHDYVTSSNETLSAALLHCDLDEIKQKLDTIIEQNNRIIIQNAIQIAQNSQMLQQNQQMLSRLASIESNTDRAAQYAEIASNNAEACAWIGMANYIKD